MVENQHEEHIEDQGPPSKSALKREMTARQALGEALCELSATELAAMAIEDPALLEAINESHRIHSRSALKRHRQYIGKLMRGIDPEPIRATLDAMHQRRSGKAQVFQDLEALRDALLEDPDTALVAVLERFPDADRQHLRQLARQAQRDAGSDRNSGASRRVFRYLRELQED